MMRSIYNLRRKIAQAIFPEMVSLLAPKAGEYVHSLSPCTLDIIRLGRELMAFSSTSDFADVCGYSRRKPGKNSPEPPQGYYKVLRMQNDWRAFVRRPPSNVSERIYDRFMQFFSDHWPEELEWPNDIPRPAKSKEAA